MMSKIYAAPRREPEAHSSKNQAISQLRALACQLQSSDAVTQPGAFVNEKGVPFRWSPAHAFCIVLLLRHELHGVGPSLTARRSNPQRPFSVSGAKGIHCRGAGPFRRAVAHR